MALFGWVAERLEPPPRWDLRRAGWNLGQPARGRVCLVDMRGRSTPPDLSDRAELADCVFLGVASGSARARLLTTGAGDALPEAVDLPELEQRVSRLAATHECLPRRRVLGPLTLDLLHRDAQGGGGWLALHPREFELFWRLAERPGEAVSRTQLLREVWRLEFEPGTNSIEVHVSRLRAKLAAAGIVGLIETDRRGGYRLAGQDNRIAEPLDQRLCA